MINKVDNKEAQMPIVGMALTKMKHDQATDL